MSFTIGCFVNFFKICRIDWDTPSISINITLPHIRTEADYDINGKVLVVPISGKGKSNGTFSKLENSLYRISLKY